MTRSLRRTRKAPRPAAAAAAAREPSAIQLFLFRAESFLGTQMFDGSRPVAIGRSAHAELSLQGDAISRHHCRLSLEDGVIWLEDLGSANGTYVNRVCVAERTAVQPTDAIHLGAYTIKVRALRAAATPALLDPTEAERITKVEAVLSLDTDGQREAVLDLGAGFDRRLYEDAVRRATGGERAREPQAAEALAEEPSSADTEATDGEASEARPATTAMTALRADRDDSLRPEPRAAQRPDPGMEARLRDLDALIATLDAREKSQHRSLVQLETIDGFLGREVGSPVSLAFTDPARHASTGIDRETLEALRELSTGQFARDLASGLAVAGEMIGAPATPKTSVDAIAAAMEQEATEQLHPDEARADDPRPELEAPTTRAETRSPPVAPAPEVLAAKGARGPAAPAQGAPAPAKDGGLQAATAHSRSVMVPATSAIAAARAEAAHKPTSLSSVSRPPAAPPPAAQSSSPPPLPRRGTVPRAPLGDAATDRDEATPVALDKPKRSAAAVRGAVPRGRSAMLDEPELVRRPGRRLEVELITQTSMKVGVMPVPAEPGDAAPARTRARASRARSLSGAASGVARGASAFDAVEISARARGALVDIAVLREVGEQYVLGHKTPQGRVAPTHTHAGLRMLRLNPDRTVDLVFPREVAGHLVRGKETVMFNELTEGRKYSCLRLEARDIATLILGEGQHAISYHVRFIRRAPGHGGEG